MRTHYFAASLAALVLLASCFGAAAEEKTLVLKTATGAHSYNVEVADTTAERAKGLMFRRSLPQKSGMIFLYDQPQELGMWMKNTYIPLDMVFIDASGKVHRVEMNTEPFSTEIITSGGAVTAVLELNAGETERIGLKPGDSVVFPGLGAAD